VHREDRLRSDGGADRVVLVTGFPLDRAPWLGPRRGRVGGAQDRGGCAVDPGQTELDLGLTAGVEPGTLPITSSRMSHLWDALCAAYRALGFELATKADNVFRDLVLAGIIEPTSKIDASRVLTEVGVDAASYATVKRRLPIYAQPSWRQALSSACAARARLGPASLVHYDVSTLLCRRLIWGNDLEFVCLRR
jgi:hypothetical protein